MIPVYDEKYLDDAMKNLAEAFDYAANPCQTSLDDFMDLFDVSGYAELFAAGTPNYVSGMSGTELVMRVIEKSGKRMTFPEPQVEYDCSSEYWCGWNLAYYQWATGKSFREIHRSVSMAAVLALYPTLHEASDEKFVATLNAILRQKQDQEPSRLQQQRKLCGCSQSQLAQKSGVNLRTLQQYESGAKSLCRASVQTVRNLARTLGCGIEDILENV